MSPIDKFRAMLRDARSMVADSAVANAIGAELADFDAACDRGAQVAEAHIANWFRGVYTAPDGTVVSPAGQDQAAPAAAAAAPAPGTTVQAVPPA